MDNFESGDSSELLAPGHVPIPTDEDKKVFFVGLRIIVFPKSAILATCFSQHRDDSAVPKHLSRSISSLYDPKYKKLHETSCIGQGV